MYGYLEEAASCHKLLSGNNWHRPPLLGRPLLAELDAMHHPVSHAAASFLLLFSACPPNELDGRLNHNDNNAIQPLWRGVISIIIQVQGAEDDLCNISGLFRFFLGVQRFHIVSIHPDPVADSCQVMSRPKSFLLSGIIRFDKTPCFFSIKFRDSTSDLM